MVTRLSWPPKAITASACRQVEGPVLVGISTMVFWLVRWMGQGTRALVWCRLLLGVTKEAFHDPLHEGGVDGRLVDGGLDDES